MVHYKYKDGTSIKLCVHPDYEGADFNKPVSFTCDGEFYIRFNKWKFTSFYGFLNVVLRIEMDGKL